MINFLLNISSIFSMNLNKYNAELMPISIIVPYLASDATMNSLGGRVKITFTENLGLQTPSPCQQLVDTAITPLHFYGNKGRPPSPIQCQTQTFLCRVTAMFETLLIFFTVAPLTTTLLLYFMENSKVPPGEQILLQKFDFYYT